MISHRRTKCLNKQTATQTLCKLYFQLSVWSVYKYKYDSKTSVVCIHIFPFGINKIRPSVRTSVHPYIYLPQARLALMPQQPAAVREGSPEINTPIEMVCICSEVEACGVWPKCQVCIKISKQANKKQTNIIPKQR